MTMKPVNLREDLIGKEGETRTEVYLDGTVYVGGEEWWPHRTIPAGMPVRVIGRDGRIVVVEPVEVQLIPCPLRRGSSLNFLWRLTVQPVIYCLIGGIGASGSYFPCHSIKLCPNTSGWLFSG